MTRLSRHPVRRTGAGRALAVTLLVGALLVGAWGIIPRAYANPEPITRLDADLAGQLLEAIGLTVTRKTDARGDPILVFKMEDTQTGLFFFDCSAAGCESVQLMAVLAGTDAGPAVINAWNANTLHTRAYRVDEHAILESDFNVAGGVTLNNFSAFLAHFSNATPEFTAHLSAPDTPIATPPGPITPEHSTADRSGAAPETSDPTTTGAFRDCATCPEMIALPAGRFAMGNPEARQHAFYNAEDEGPVHDVALPAFALGRFEITRTQWQACVDAGRCDALAGPGDVTDPDDHPATNLTWMQTRDYAAWLSEITGARYRLPSEAEWEYAARAGRTLANIPEPGRQRGAIGANCLDADHCRDGFPGTAPVGRFPANPWGFHDLQGNVAEWTADCYHDSYRGAPTDGRPRGGTDCELRVLRGGGFKDPANALRVTERSRGLALMNLFGGEQIGLRVARDLAPGETFSARPPSATPPASPNRSGGGDDHPATATPPMPEGAATALAGRVVSLAVQRAEDVDDRCRVTLGAYNLDHRAFPELRVWLLAMTNGGDLQVLKFVLGAARAGRERHAIGTPHALLAGQASRCASGARLCRRGGGKRRHQPVPETHGDGSQRAATDVRRRRPRAFSRQPGRVELTPPQSRRTWIRPS